MSNKLDEEVGRRKPEKWPHGKVVGVTVMDGNLLFKVSQRKERMGIIEALLVLPVAALHFAVVSSGVWTNQLVPDSHLGGGFFKKGGKAPFAIGKTIGKLKAIIGMDTFHMDSPAVIPVHQPFEEVCG